MARSFECPWGVKAQFTIPFKTSFWYQAEKDLGGFRGTWLRCETGRPAVSKVKLKTKGSTWTRFIAANRAEMHLYARAKTPHPDSVWGNVLFTPSAATKAFMKDTFWFIFSCDADKYLLPVANTDMIIIHVFIMTPQKRYIGLHLSVCSCIHVQLHCLSASQKTGRNPYIPCVKFHTYYVWALVVCVS